MRDPLEVLNAFILAAAAVEPFEAFKEAWGASTMPLLPLLPYPESKTFSRRERRHLFFYPICRCLLDHLRPEQPTAAQFRALYTLYTLHTTQRGRPLPIPLTPDDWDALLHLARCAARLSLPDPAIVIRSLHASHAFAYSLAPYRDAALGSASSQPLQQPPLEPLPMEPIRRAAHNYVRALAVLHDDRLPSLAAADPARVALDRIEAQRHGSHSA